MPKKYGITNERRLELFEIVMESAWMRVNPGTVINAISTGDPLEWTKAFTDCEETSDVDGAGLLVALNNSSNVNQEELLELAKPYLGKMIERAIGAKVTIEW